MGMECGVCERDLRGGHAPDCPRKFKPSHHVVLDTFDIRGELIARHIQEISECDCIGNATRRWGARASREMSAGRCAFFTLRVEVIDRR